MMSPMNAEEHSVPQAHTFDLGPRRSWAWLTAGVTALAAAEIIGLAAIAHAVLPGPVAWAVDLAVLLPSILVLVAVGSVFTGRITVDAEHLRVHFGLLGGAVVARADIDRAELFVPTAVRPVGLGIEVPAGSHQVTVSRGGTVEFVRVLLDRPVEVRTALRRLAGVNELVLGTSEPHRLIAALG